MEINQTGLLGAASGSAAVASTTLAQNFDNFLALLTTQLQNQDPLSPLDSTEFTSQLVQFASVEQQVSQNQRLEELLSVEKSAQAVGAVGFLGTTVEAFGDKIMLDGGPVDFAYSLLPDTESAKISILDSEGNLVRSYDADTDAGKHTLTWDGINSQGVQAPNGVYQVQLTAHDAEGELLDAATSVFGLVTSVSAENGVIVLKLGDVSVPIDRIIGVKAPQTASAPAPEEGS